MTPNEPVKPPAIMIPDRVCLEVGSPYFVEASITNKIGIRFDDKVIYDAIEYCVSEGWVRRGFPDYTGRLRMERSKYLSRMCRGKVEAYDRNVVHDRKSKPGVRPDPDGVVPPGNEA